MECMSKAFCCLTCLLEVSKDSFIFYHCVQNMLIFCAVFITVVYYLQNGTHQERAFSA